MLGSSTIAKIIPVLRQAARRSLKMKVQGFPAPYYCSYLLRDNHSYDTWASTGCTYSKSSDQTRSVYCDIRVGNYKYDQTIEGGLTDNDEELESAELVSVPIDDSITFGLQVALWRLTEVKFREALADYKHKQAMRVSKLDPNRSLPSFTKLKPQRYIQNSSFERVDLAKWAKFCKEASRWMSELPSVFGDSVEFAADQETRIFVSSENRVIVQHHQMFSLIASFRRLTSDGSHVVQELVLNVASQSELPDMREFKKLAEKKYDQLMNLTEATHIHAFSGPVLLYPGPAGILFHEAIGHRLEGNRLLSHGEGQTFKGQVGKRVLGIELSIKDNPKLKKFKGKGCVGSYEFDDEGTPAQNAVLVENGILKGFLSSRAHHAPKHFTLNGHARNKEHQRPISRMAVTMVDGKNGLSMQTLREMLVREINRQKKPFGMIVYETSGGETETTTYDFQAFFGEISYASLVYPDGREECVRGVNFVGTPLQALHNVIAVGKDLEMENGYCGAESGFIPITTIAPAVLLRNLELQAKDEELVTQYILPRPKP